MNFTARRKSCPQQLTIRRSNPCQPSIASFTDG
jgi:hypothetical protein